MNKDYCLSGTKVTVRRLFKQDFEDIMSCYDEYKTLYHNPLSAAFFDNVFLYGEIWGAYLGDSIIGCCYYFPMKSEFFTDTRFYAAIADFTNETEKYFYMGYVGIKYEKVLKNTDSSVIHPTESGLYQAFLNVAQMQAFRRGLKYILHASPAKLGRDIETLLCCGCHLVRMRGLDNLVVHHIFVKAVFNEENIYETNLTESPVRIPFDDTKKVSALLENGYCGVDYSKNDNTLLIRKLIAD